MPACSAVSCVNHSSIVNLISSGVTYHRFPKETDLKMKWISAIGKAEGWMPRAHSVVCSTHFEPKYFVEIMQTKRLVSWAVPTLNLEPFPELCLNNNNNYEAPKPPTQPPFTERERTLRLTVRRQKYQIKRLKKILISHRMQLFKLKLVTREIREMNIRDQNKICLKEDLTIASLIG